MISMEWLRTLTASVCMRSPISETSQKVSERQSPLSYRQLLPAAKELQRTSSFGGVVPVALTNTQATADEATHGAPVTGPGIAEPFPPDAHDAALPSPAAMMDSEEQAPQVCAALVILPVHACELHSKQLSDPRQECYGINPVHLFLKALALLLWQHVRTLSPGHIQPSP